MAHPLNVKGWAASLDAGRTRYQHTRRAWLVSAWTVVTVAAVGPYLVGWL